MKNVTHIFNKYVSMEFVVIFCIQHFDMILIFEFIPCMEFCNTFLKIFLKTYSTISQWDTTFQKI